MIFKSKSNIFDPCCRGELRTCIAKQQPHKTKDMNSVDVLLSKNLIKLKMIKHNAHFRYKNASVGYQV